MEKLAYRLKGDLEITCLNITVATVVICAGEAMAAAADERSSYVWADEETLTFS